jgi:hypothetical protein
MQILSLTSALVKTVDIANSIYIIKETVPEFNFLTVNYNFCRQRPKYPKESNFRNCIQGPIHVGYAVRIRPARFKANTY